MKIMNKSIFKRIMGLFIFALTIMIFTITSVDAATCDDVIEKLNKNDLARYGLSMEYDKDSDKYIIRANVKDITPFQKFDPSFKKSKIKFKVAGLYFYEPTGNEKDDLRNGNINTVEDESHKINEYKSNGSISDLTIVNGGEILIRSSIFNARVDSNKIGVAIKLVPDGFTSISGRPSAGDKDKTTIGTDYTGYVQVVDIDLTDVPATDAEKDDIIRLLRSGVYV